LWASVNGAQHLAI